MAEFQQPTLPAEVEWTTAEQTFREEEPRRLFPENQDSNWGLVRKIFSDVVDDLHEQLHTIFTEMFPQTSQTYLDEWEYMVGLPRNPAGKTLQQRRAAVIARLISGPFTRTIRYNIVDSYIQPIFGDSIKLFPPGVEMVPAGVPIYNDFVPGPYFQICETVTTFYYEIQILASVIGGVDQVGLTAALNYIQYAGLHFSIVSVPTLNPC